MTNTPAVDSTIPTIVKISGPPHHRMYAAVVPILFAGATDNASEVIPQIVTWAAAFGVVTGNVGDTFAHASES